MYSILKPVLFLLSPERAHSLSVWLLDIAVKVMPRLLRTWYCVEDKTLQRTVMGIQFPNPIGLAAGFDKDGKHIEGLSMLGFGFVEVGTVTPISQEGNPKPRLFRLPADRALINRMGFNNEGLDALVGRLKAIRERGVPRGIVIGGNIGKNKVTLNENAVSDYVSAFEALFDHVDYFAINVSSPNTPNLRDLQEKEPLKVLLNTLQQHNFAKPTSKPILLKIAPDLTDTQLLDIIEIINETQIQGVIATNTTLSREKLTLSSSEIETIGNGGLSGKPLRERSTEVIRFLAEKSNKSFVIMGVGGIHSPNDAREKLAAGADLIQIYTGFIYEGPGMIKKILKNL